MGSISTSFNRRKNSLNFIRLVFALAVIVSHTWPLTGAGPEPMLGDMTLGHCSVAGFFAISGYLITASRMNDDSTLRYLWRRVLRIYPAYWVCIALVGLVAAPAVWYVSGHGGLGVYTRTDGGLAYIVKNATLFRGQADVAGTTIDGFPHAGEWNGSLWSLPFEFACYVIVAVLGVTAGLRKTKVPLYVTAVALLILNIIYQYGPLEIDSYYISRFLTFGLFFFGGAVLWALSDRLPLTWILAAASAVAMVVFAWLGVTEILSALPLAYLCIWLGDVLPLDSVGSVNDISYGVYLYAFPIQQLLVFAGLRYGGPWFFAFIAALSSVVVAYASCKLIEQPALRLKSWTPTRRPRNPQPGETPVGAGEVFTRP
ncbi:acyltransferase family protein [Rhodococcus sp. NPDC019627]|uniref:acyltransferase family protein n=1 Tax=unclassified Rhodococcus (in: high G+C Gram-positive bacteria) TaxID=192944 RepID=UPI0034006F90